MKYRLTLSPEAEKTIRQLAPDLKRKIRFALEEIQEDPYLGKPLKDELKGLRSYRVHHYRIVYRIHHHQIEIQVIDIGPRSLIYDRVVAAIRIQGGGR